MSVSSNGVEPVMPVARPRRKLGRLGLLIWLATPIALVVAMWFLIDRSQGVPRTGGGRKMGSPQTAPVATDAKPLPSGSSP